MFALATAENYSYKALCGNSFNFRYTFDPETSVGIKGTWGQHRKPAMQIRIGDARSPPLQNW